MTLSSWTLDNSRLNLDIDGSDNFEFSIYRESNEWMLVDSSASKHVERYFCGHTHIGLRPRPRYGAAPGELL